MSALAIICAWLSLVLLISIRSFRKKAYRRPPGPRRLPIVGNLFQVRSPLHRCLWKLAQRYGPLMYLRLGKVHIVVVSSATVARDVLKTHDLQLCSRAELTSLKKFSYNFLDVAFAPYGEYWREMRKMVLMELFNQKRVESFHLIREEEVHSMINEIAEASGPVNLTEAVVRLSNDVTCRTALGRKYRDGEEGRFRFREAMEEAQALFMELFAADYVRGGSLFDWVSGKQRRLDKTFWKIDALYTQVISDHLFPQKPRTNSEDFVDVLLRIHKQSGLPMECVKALLMNIIFAGTDTSASAIIWAMAELTRNPAAMSKAREEVRRVIRGKKMVQESELHQLEYLHCILKETLRLHPPAPLLIPHEARQACFIGGHEIEEKTRIYVNAFAIGRDPSSWDRPEEFLPERFSSSSIDYKGNDFELIPFGAGRRICPGMLTGTTFVKLALASLLYHFDWKLPDGVKAQDMAFDETPGITVLKKSPLVLHPRPKIYSF